MARFNNPLDKVRVAAPCNADWEAMIGNDRSRFCGHCSLNVYNLSSMSRAEAESLIARSEGRLCVRFYRRADGSILTRNCPVGLRALHRRVSSLSKAIATTALSFFAGLGIYQGLSAFSILNPPPRYRTMGVMVQGDAVLSPPPFVEPMQPERATLGGMTMPITDPGSLPRKVSRKRR